MKEESTKGGNWELYYHHFLNGRSAYIRLIFEELGIPYEDMVKTREDIMKFFYSDEKLANTGFPVLHPPVIKNGIYMYLKCLRFSSGRSRVVAGVWHPILVEKNCHFMCKIDNKKEK